MITLQQITWDNVEECLELDVADDQKSFVASNVYSIAQSYVALLNDKRPPMTYAIYTDDTMIGFTMLYYDEADENEYGDEPCYGVCRFMIDKEYQRNGFGKQAMGKVLDHIRTLPQGEASTVYLSYDRTNVIAKDLYESLGFVETGVVNDSGELVARLEL